MGSRKERNGGHCPAPLEIRVPRKKTVAPIADTSLLCAFRICSVKIYPKGKWLWEQEGRVLGKYLCRLFPGGGLSHPHRWPLRLAPSMPLTHPACSTRAQSRSLTEEGRVRARSPLATPAPADHQCLPLPASNGLMSALKQNKKHAWHLLS